MSGGGTGGPGGPGEAPAAVVERVRVELGATGLAVEEPAPGRFAVALPGERKQATTVVVAVGRHALLVQAFVLRAPEERAADVHRWLLERNLRLFGVAWALDRHGDVHLVARLPHSAAGELDRLLGAVLAEADGAFDALLALGFGGAIRREHAWRTARGEPTANLEAFRHLLDDPPGDAPGDLPGSP